MAVIFLQKIFGNIYIRTVKVLHKL